MPLQSQDTGDTIQLRSWCVGTVIQMYKTTDEVENVTKTQVDLSVDMLLEEATKLENWMRRDDIHNKATVTPLSAVN